MDHEPSFLNLARTGVASTIFTKCLLKSYIVKILNSCKQNILLTCFEVVDDFFVNVQDACTAIESRFFGGWKIFRSISMPFQVGAWGCFDEFNRISIEVGQLTKFYTLAWPFPSHIKFIHPVPEGVRES